MLHKRPLFRRRRRQQQQQKRRREGAWILHARKEESATVKGSRRSVEDSPGCPHLRKNTKTLFNLSLFTAHC